MHRSSDDDVPAATQPLVSRSPYQYESGGEAFVAVMQAADLRNFEPLSNPAWHDRAWFGAILVEPQMRAVALVAVDVRGQDAPQAAPVEDHYVVQTIAAN